MFKRVKNLAKSLVLSTGLILSVAALIAQGPAPPTNVLVNAGLVEANPITATRLPAGDTSLPNTVWAGSGVVGGIPSAGWSRCTTGTGTSVLASSSTAAQINTAINGCDANHYVELGTGTFSLNGAILMSKDGIALRGQGPSATILNFTSTSGSGWWYAGSAAAFVIQGGGSFSSAYVGDVAPTIGGGANIVNWTGTNGASGVYTQGATLIDLSSATSYAVGDMIILYQNDEPDANLPMTGFFISDETSSNGISVQGEYNDHDAAMTQRAMITAKSGNQVTITPPIIAASTIWRTGLAPKAARTSAANVVSTAGVENLTIQTTSLTDHQCAICVQWASNVWVKGVGIKPKVGTWHGGGGAEFGVLVNDSVNIEVRDSWIDKMLGGRSGGATTSYGVACQGTTLLRMENNILNNVESPTEVLVGCTAMVVGYNFENYVGDSSPAQEGGIQQHSVGAIYTLAEGNSYKQFWADVFHGNTSLSTYARNHMQQTGFNLHSYHRFYNLIGNVITASNVRKTCVTDVTDYSRFASYGFRLGYAASSASSGSYTEGSNSVAADSAVCTTTMIWGNYTSTGGSVFDSAEVPSGDATFPNPVPSSQTLPNSFYRSARPGFFTLAAPISVTVAWPLHGPDVTGGFYLAGHANKTPAQLVYEATSGNSIANFNPSVYGTTP